ncbi:transposase [Streptomyces sp. DT195]|uniref:transposase n=1 Tax=Streptomyces sp. DT195 TaxID=3393419 RepID=UPI003CE682A0
MYGTEISKSTISTITDSVMAGMTEWQNRPLDSVYPVIFIDCVIVKVRDGQVANRPIYMAVAVTAEGHRDILGLWIGDGGREVLAPGPDRDQEPRCGRCPDAGLRRPDRTPGRVNTVWPATIVQTCVVQLLRNSFRYAARQDWEKIAKALRPVYTASTEDAALERFVEFTDAWGGKYPAIVRLWEAAWAEFVPFLQFDVEIRKIICTTNAVESINARIRKAVPGDTSPPTRPPSSASTWPS